MTTECTEHPKSLPAKPSWFEEEDVGICESCHDTAQTGEWLQVGVRDWKGRCIQCATFDRVYDGDDGGGE